MDGDPPVDVTVLLYASDPAVRERLRLTLGAVPPPRAADGAAGGAAPVLGRVTWLEAASAPELNEVLAAHRDVDVAVLDGEAQPAGGIGVARQLTEELRDLPGLVVLVQRDADRWLATWSRAHAVLPRDPDPERLTEVVLRLALERRARPPLPVETGLLGFPKKGRR